MSLILLLAAMTAGPSEPTIKIEKLNYVKRATREETRQATLEATGLSALPGKWKYIGPFDNPDGKGLSTPHPPESEVDFSKTYPGKGGTPAAWRDGDFPDGKINDLKVFSKENNQQAIVYLLREIVTERPGELPISLGSDDSIKVFINGQEALTSDSVRACAPDQHRLSLPLVAGRNQILLKVGQVDGFWQFYFSPTLSEKLHAELRNRLDADFPLEDEGKSYRLVNFPIPDSLRLEVGGMCFRKDGGLLVGTRRGSIWLIKKPLAETFEDFELIEWASGLHEITGMAMVGDAVYVAHRPELTIVTDTDGDDRADEYKTFCDSWGVSGDYHEFVFGPARDAKGNSFIALNLGFAGGPNSLVPWRGWIVKIDPSGKMTPFASGMRSPNSLNFSPQGDLFYCDNQGDWVAACKLSHVEEGDFHGNPISLRWAKNSKGEPPKPKPPAVWFPYGTMSQSAAEPIWDTTGGKFGPFEGQCLVGEQVKSLIMRVALEKVDGHYQGACFHFRRGFECGVNRIAFASDGSLFAGMTSRGWGSVGGKPFGLQRLVYTGVEPFDIYSVSLTPTGFDLRFTQPIDAAAAGEIKSYSLQSYHYNYWSTYGSPEVDRRPVSVEAVTVGSDGKSVSLKVDGLKTGKVYEIIAEGVRSSNGNKLLHPEAYYTLNYLRAKSK